MTLDQAIPRLRDCARKMNEIYGRTIFDEWAVVSLLPECSRLLDYSGPRKDEFAGKFSRDLAELRQSLLKGRHHFGDFEFAAHRHADPQEFATRFEERHKGPQIRKGHTSSV